MVRDCLPQPYGMLPKDPLFSHLTENSEVIGMTKRLKDNGIIVTRVQNLSKGGRSLLTASLTHHETHPLDV